MFAGHFGLAAAVKAQQKTIPLWALMVSTFLIDIIFLFLYLAGIETLEQAPGAQGSYAPYIIHADYSHALVTTVVLAIVVGLLAMRPWGRQAGGVLGGVVLSHWILDLIVHRPDMPILPGGAYGLPYLGLGLWDYPMISLALEALIVLAGAFLYFRAAMRLPAPSIRSSNEYQSRKLMAAGITAILLLLSLVTTALGLS